MSASSGPPGLDPGQLLRLLDLAARLNRTVEPERLLNFIIWTAADVLGCEAASILLYDAEADRLRFVAATGADAAALANILVPIDGSLAGTIYRGGRPVRTEAADQDERHYDEVGEKVAFHTRSLLGVPMRIGTETVGVLEALNKTGGAFTDEDELMLAVIADQAAVAIRNARQMEALQLANVRLERSEEARSRFLALAAHELRTPLTIIEGYADILREETGPVAIEAARAITEATATMTRVLEAIGEVDRLHTGTGALQMRPIPVERLLQEAREAVAGAATTKGVRLQLHPVPGGLGVRADAERLRRALVHLLENAVRHTPPAGLVTARAVERGGGVLIEVEDTGCGMNPEDCEAVFQEFFQLEDAMTRTHGGLGLGLSIARGIAELHGGRVWARSEGPGHGSTFALWLPALGPLAPAPVPTPPAALYAASA